MGKIFTGNKRRHSLTNLMEMVLASDHGHAGRQVSDHVVSSLPQPVLLMVEGKVFLDQLLAGRHRDLHCSVDHGWRNILKIKLA